MKISVFGLGYVGCVSAAWFADQGHSVIGVDPNRTKVGILNRGMAPILEPELDDLISRAVRNELLLATADAEYAILNTEISFICVGTPSQRNGGLDYSHLIQVCTEIAAALTKKHAYHVVVVRSTVLPGSMMRTVIPLLAQISNKQPGVDFGVCSNPEFLREGTAIYDFRHPPKTVIGEIDERSGKMLEVLYSGLSAPLIRCPVEIAEMVKYTDNAWHAVKVSFANEIGKFCKACGIDSHQVMEIFCKDTKLNISSYYLRPGFAFGGSCLPKDLRALTHKARTLDVVTPLLSSILPSNREQIEFVIDMILRTGKRAVGILGISFKAGTDDLRESPLVDVIERLIGKGLDLRLYDKNVNIAKLIGSNRQYIIEVIPHIERLMVDSIEEVLFRSEVIVIGNNAPEFASAAARLRPAQRVIDLIRIKSIEEQHANYDGICW
jgi:GDP-mannose 6-dehydrogenase